MGKPLFHRARDAFRNIFRNKNPQRGVDRRKSLKNIKASLAKLEEHLKMEHPEPAKLFARAFAEYEFHPDHIARIKNFQKQRKKQIEEFTIGDLREFAGLLEEIHGEHKTAKGSKAFPEKSRAA